jgi:dihydropteroate synthase
MAFAPRPRFDWRLRTRTLPLGERTIIMGILNVTPDSFSDGGHFYSPQNAPERALAEAMRMLDEGAQILDVGGESTRPNATPLTPDEEQARILPVVESILKQRPETILSIDTFHASTAQHAIEAGGEIINDVSGHLWDASMATTCATLGCGVVLMHTRGRPREWPTLPPLAPEEVLPLVLAELADRLESATVAGTPRDKIVLDPGLGFGKRFDENYPLLARLDQLQRFNLPILVGASRKGFLGQTLSQSTALASALHPTPTDARVYTTMAANVAAILAGAHILRAHDVRPAAEAAVIADRILAAA